MEIKTQLKVTKADGQTEEYIHTKVLGTISNALENAGQTNVFLAEYFAEVVTYYLYQQQNRNRISSSEILSIIKVVLASTGYDDAALKLTQCHFERKIKRARVDVVSINIRDLADAETLSNDRDSDFRRRWDKNRIVGDLVTNDNLPHHTARAIASMVENKILNMQISVVPTSLIKQLVLRETATVVTLQNEFHTA